LSNLVTIEDLGLLDGRDLRAVLGQVPEPQILDALVGLSAARRQLLLTKLSPASASRLEARVVSHGPVAIEAVRTAQRTIVETLCRLSRGGVIAFDDPADLVA